METTEFMMGVRQRIAQEKAERFVHYAEQDLAAGRPASAAIYEAMSARQQQSAS